MGSISVFVSKFTCVWPYMAGKLFEEQDVVTLTTSIAGVADEASSEKLRSAFTTSNLFSSEKLHCCKVFGISLGQMTTNSTMAL